MINNKIYDLATQAGLITFESIHDSMAVTPNHESVAKARKFAELIIRECANICDRQGRSGWNDDRKAQARLDRDLIKQHFGVKE